MENKTNNTIRVVVMVVGIILVCAVCFFASESQIAKKGNGTSNSNSGGSNATDVTAQAQEESSAVADNEKKEFTNISMDKYLELYKGEEKKLVLFSRPTCGYCQIAEPLLQNIAYRHNLTIYHLNTDEFSGDDDEKLVKSNEYFSNGFGTPLLVVVSNGEIVEDLSGLTDTKNYEAFFSKHGFIK